VLNVPIAEGTALRIALTDGKRDGYVKNRAGFPDLNSEKYSAGRASLRFERGGPEVDLLRRCPALQQFRRRRRIDRRGSHGFGQLRLPARRRRRHGSGPQRAEGIGLLERAHHQPHLCQDGRLGCLNTTTYALSDVITLKNILGYRRTKTAPSSIPTTAGSS